MGSIERQNMMVGVCDVQLLRGRSARRKVGGRRTCSGQNGVAYE